MATLTKDVVRRRPRGISFATDLVIAWREPDRTEPRYIATFMIWPAYFIGKLAEYKTSDESISMLRRNYNYSAGVAVDWAETAPRKAPLQIECNELFPGKTWEQTYKSTQVRIFDLPHGRSDMLYFDAVWKNMPMFCVYDKPPTQQQMEMVSEDSGYVVAFISVDRWKQLRDDTIAAEHTTERGMMRYAGLLRDDRKVGG